MPEATDDPHGLQRFVDAQNHGGTYETALHELAAGLKRSHWMWFVFPQLAGLGQSPMARRYAIGSLAEARAYLAHELLGPRLVSCSTLVAETGDRTAEQIFGATDAVKLRSSMTLFATAAPANLVFGRVLEAKFGGKPDELTLQAVGG